RLQAPLTPDERPAEQYLDRPARLLELAAETRNRALYQIARGISATRRASSSIGARIGPPGG
ncbi:MAG: hypothetical protein ACYCW7_00535, partial [Pseudomonadaceae bacterium]